jgi:hypothetical protein
MIRVEAAPKELTSLKKFKMQIKRKMLVAKHNASYVLKANKYRPKSLECFFKATNLVQCFALEVGEQDQPRVFTQ